MNENFEQDVPFVAMIAGFIVLMIATGILRKWLRSRELIREGQLPPEQMLVPSIEKRIVANRAWASGEIRSAGRGLVAAVWLLALVWNLTFGVSFVKFLSDPATQLGPRIVLGIFAFLGIVPVIFAVRLTMRWFRFGNSWCRIDGKAGVLGKVISGSFRCSKEVKATGDYQVTIQCVENYTVGTGKNSRSETRLHWQGKQSVPHIGKSALRGIPFSIELPPFPPETGYQLARGKINWQLRVDAPVEGVDYLAMFIVPVFKMS